MEAHSRRAAQLARQLQQQGAATAASSAALRAQDPDAASEHRRSSSSSLASSDTHCMSSAEDVVRSSDHSMTGRLSTVSEAEVHFEPAPPPPQQHPHGGTERSRCVCIPFLYARVRVVVLVCPLPHAAFAAEQCALCGRCSRNVRETSLVQAEGAWGIVGAVVEAHVMSRSAPLCCGTFASPCSQRRPRARAHCAAVAPAAPSVAAVHLN